MPATYNGNAAAITPHATVTITVPVDGDMRAASSVNIPIEKLADLVEYLMEKAGLLDQANTWTATSTFVTRQNFNAASGLSIFATGGPGAAGVEAIGGSGNSTGLFASGIGTGAGAQCFPGDSANSVGVRGTCTVGAGQIGVFGETGASPGAGQIGVEGVAKAGAGTGACGVVGAATDSGGIGVVADSFGAADAFKADSSSGTGYGARCIGNGTKAALHLNSQSTPSSLADGDIWYDGTHLYCRIGGATKQLDN